MTCSLTPRPRMGGTEVIEMHSSLQTAETQGEHVGYQLCGSFLFAKETAHFGSLP